jgi:trk system potassium uptake protein TrkH
MNSGMVFYIVGQILKAEAVFMAVPLFVSMYYNDSCTGAFLISGACCLGAGLLVGSKRPAETTIFAREGFVAVSLSWLTMSFFGSLPYLLSGALPNFADSWFETVSGFTTTGATVLADIGAVERGLLFWRSFTQWIGGMGVLIFIVAVIPQISGRGIHLLRAEMPGPIIGKLLPKARNTAISLYGIYIFLTLVLAILLKASGLGFYDSAVHALTTAATGGFSPHSASVAHFAGGSTELIIAVFMVLFGINFNLFFFLLVGNFRAVAKNKEFRAYLSIIAVSAVIVALNISRLYQSFWLSLRAAFFQVGSIMTTTGYFTADFSTWPTLSKILLVGLMLLGGCASSTAGGIKIARVQILISSLKREISRMLHPRSVRIVTLDDRAVDEETVSGAHAYLTAFFVVGGLSLLLLSADGLDFETTVSAVAACLNNIGPGLGLVGPNGNYSCFSGFSKLILSVDMLLGRLEIFPLIILFSPAVWRKR